MVTAERVNSDLWCIGTNCGDLTTVAVLFFYNTHPKTTLPSIPCSYVGPCTYILPSGRERWHPLKDWVCPGLAPAGGTVGECKQLPESEAKL